MQDYFEKYTTNILLDELKHADGRIYFHGAFLDLSACTLSAISAKADSIKTARLAKAKVKEQHERYFAHFDEKEQYKAKANELQKTFDEFFTKAEKENAQKRFITVEPCKYNFDDKAVKGSFAFNSYGDNILDELAKALLFAFLGQRTAQPEKASFWNLKAYELITANKNGEICGTFFDDAYIKFMEYDEKERTKNMTKYARKAANNAVYQYKYKGDGKSLAGNKNDIAEENNEENTIIFLANIHHYAEKQKSALIERYVSHLTEKQAYCIAFYLANCVQFNTFEDIYEFGTDIDGKPIKFFKNFDGFARTFYNARKALKAFIKEDEKADGYLPNINTLFNSLYQNKTYNAEILSARYEKAKADSMEREKARTASGTVLTYTIK